MRGLDKQRDLAMMPSRLRHHPHGRDMVVSWLIGRGMIPPIHTPDSGGNTWNRRNTMRMRLFIDVSDGTITWEELTEAIEARRPVGLTIDPGGEGEHIRIVGTLTGAQEVHT
jgi:hypothetical protein